MYLFKNTFCVTVSSLSLKDVETAPLLDAVGTKCYFMVNITVWRSVQTRQPYWSSLEVYRGSFVSLNVSVGEEGLRA